MFIGKCDHLSENPHSSHKHVYWKKKRNLKIICEIMHTTEKYLQGLMGLAISKGKFKSTKTIHQLTCVAMESLKIFVSFP